MEVGRSPTDSVRHSENAIAAKHAGQFVQPSVNLKTFYMPNRWPNCCTNSKYSHLLALGRRALLVQNADANGIGLGPGHRFF